MPVSKLFRGHAAECRAGAGQATSEVEHDILIELAKVWDRAAREVELPRIVTGEREANSFAEAAG